MHWRLTSEGFLMNQNIWTNYLVIFVCSETNFYCQNKIVQWKMKEFPAPVNNTNFSVPLVNGVNINLVRAATMFFFIFIFRKLHIQTCVGSNHCDIIVNHLVLIWFTRRKHVTCSRFFFHNYLIYVYDSMNCFD